MSRPGIHERKWICSQKCYFNTQETQELEGQIFGRALIFDHDHCYSWHKVQNFENSIFAPQWWCRLLKLQFF